MILDGYGEGKPSQDNAVVNANTPFLHGLKKGSYSLLKTDSQAVGLLNNVLGGSEVGHMTIGAGRVIPSTIKKIEDDILSGEFARLKGLNATLDKLSTNNGDLHLIGLMSDKNIHSNINHAIEIINLAKNKAKNIFVHYVTDGRDSGVYDTEKYYKLFREKTKGIANLHVLSMGGRYYAMDREGNLDRTKLAFDAMFDNSNAFEERDFMKYVRTQYDAGITDEFIKPIHFKIKEYTKLSKNDCIMFFNFREDRLRQMVKMTSKLHVPIVTMSYVGGSKTVALYKEKIVKHTLSEHLSQLGLRQIKISESTKYAHVTYFFNGGREDAFDGEDRVHVPTVKTDDYAKTPKMRAKEITEEIIKAIDSEYDCIIANFSNPDMIGHTGNYEAIVKALEFMDKCVKKVVVHAKKSNYAILITADHGNSESTLRADGTPHTAHTFNPVMFVAIDNVQLPVRSHGSLQDVAPTILDIMGVKNNKYFEGKTLLN